MTGTEHRVAETTDSININIFKQLQNIKCSSDTHRCGDLRDQPFRLEQLMVNVALSCSD